MNAEEKKGYEDAIKALKKMLNGSNNGQGGGSSELQTPGQKQKGKSGGSGSGNEQSTDPNGNPMQAPTLNPGDQEKAIKNARKAAKEGEEGQASSKSRKEAAEAGVSQGGMISQETGAEIAKSEGYDGDDVKKIDETSLRNSWKEQVITACSKDNGPGFGSVVQHVSKYWITSHDWKSDLRKYIGKALSHVDDERKLGKKKWLAQDELKKYDTPGNNELDNIVFLIDCSGSLSDDLLQKVVSEAFSVVKKKKINKVTYAFYDNGIRQIDTNDMKKPNSDNVVFTRLKSVMPTSDIHGRGGNYEEKALSDLIDLLGKNKRKLELLMWFTDGYTNSIPKSPKNIKHTIWVIFDNTKFETKDGSKVIHINSADIGK